MTEHPITPPPELVEQWARYQGFESPEVLWRQIATQSARWGADQELEACCEWFLLEGWHPDHPNKLRAARRPKPPNLKAQALALIDECTDPHGDYLDNNALATIRRALEALPDV